MPSNNSGEITGRMDAYTVPSDVEDSEGIGVGHVENFCISLSTHSGKCKGAGLTQVFFAITKS